MKLRYYLRGLGIGILVTALIMGMTTKASRPLTDAEIKAKALALGMVDPDSLSLGSLGGATTTPASRKPAGDEPDYNPGPEGDGEDIGGGDGEEDMQTPEAGDVPEETIEPTQEPTQMPAIESASPEPAPLTTPEGESVETVTISIVRGDSSYTVSRRLEEVGLVEDAGEFDSYLVDNGYSKTIRTGTYQIPVDATWEEIAKIIA